MANVPRFGLRTCHCQFLSGAVVSRVEKKSSPKFAFHIWEERVAQKVCAASTFWRKKLSASELHLQWVRRLWHRRVQAHTVPTACYRVTGCCSSAQNNIIKRVLVVFQWNIELFFVRWTITLCPLFFLWEWVKACSAVLWWLPLMLINLRSLIWFARRCHSHSKAVWFYTLLPYICPVHVPS